MRKSIVLIIKIKSKINKMFNMSVLVVEDILILINHNIVRLKSILNTSKNKRNNLIPFLFLKKNFKKNYLKIKIYTMLRNVQNQLFNKKNKL